MLLILSMVWCRGFRVTDTNRVTDSDVKEFMPKFVKWTDATKLLMLMKMWTCNWIVESDIFKTL